MSQPSNPQQPGQPPEQYAPSGQPPLQQSPYQQPQYQQPQYAQMPPQSNSWRLERTDRELWKWVLFGILTLGIYQIVVMTELANAANRIIQDGKRTMHFCLMVFVFSWLTLGIAVLVWYHRLSNRIGDELQRRGYAKMISSNDYWLFSVLPSVIFGAPLTYQNTVSPGATGWWDVFAILGIIGPLYYHYKLFLAMNALCWDQNARNQQAAGLPVG